MKPKGMPVTILRFGVVALVFAWADLLGLRCFASGTTTYVYVLDGGRPGDPAVTVELDDAALKYGLTPGMVVNVYNSDLTRRDDPIRTLDEDIAAQPLGTSTYVFAWSYGVYNVNTFIQLNKSIDLLVTVDGTQGIGSGDYPVSLDLGSTAAVVMNYLSGDPLLHGTSHQVAEGVKYSEFDLYFFSFHALPGFPSFLDWLQENLGVIDTLMMAARANALSQQGLPGESQGSIGDSGQGGTESYPLWAFQNASQASSNSTRSLDLTPLTSLNDLLPTNGPHGESAIATSPPVVGITTATAATGRAYIDTNSDTSVAGIFLAETVTNIYEHDYVVCRRVHGYQILEIAPFGYQGSSWWLISATNNINGCSEIAIPFIVYVRGSNAFVDSQYLVDLYGPKSFDKVYNFQIWAVSLSEATGLLDMVLHQVSEHFNVQYNNTGTNSYPPVIVSSAKYVAPYIRVDVINRTMNSIDTSFAGPLWTEPNFMSESIFSNTVTLQSGEQMIDLPVGGLHDAVIYVEPGALSDKFYISSGYWFSFDDSSAGGTSSVSFQQQALVNPLILETAYWFANPPAINIHAQVTSTLSWSYVGLGYSLDPDNNPVDVRSAMGVGFWTKGDGRHYRVKVESRSVTDGDYYGYTFIAPANWTMIEIPFSDLQQEGWGQPAALDPEHVRTVSFVTTERPYDPVFSIDRLAFLGSPSPPLSISGSGPNITLAWPNSASTFSLGSAFALQSFAGETTISLRPQILATNYSVTLPATNSAMFFRLRRN